MAINPPSKTLALSESPRNVRPPGRPFYLDPHVCRSFPARHRSELVHFFNLLVALESRAPDRPVITSQPEFAEELGCSLRQVRYLEAELEDLGAVRVLRNFPGLRGGRAIELQPLDSWVPEAAVRGPRPTLSGGLEGRSEFSTSTVENYPTPAHFAGVGGTGCRGEERNAPNTARARQSKKEEIDQKGSPNPSATDGPRPAAVHARALFGFLRKHAGIANRSWREALPRLEALVGELGEKGAWGEVQRIVLISRQAVNPGGYAFACLFPDSEPERLRTGVSLLPEVHGPGPLFDGLDQNRAGKPDGSPCGARAAPDATPRTGAAENAP